MKTIAGFLILSAIAVIVYSAGSTYAHFSDTSTVSGNSFSTAGCWTRSGAAFDSGERFNDIDVTSGGIQLRRTGNHYKSPGTYDSQIIDTGRAGATIDSFSWQANMPPETSYVLKVRASDTKFNDNSNTPAWQTLTGSAPVTTGLPSGRYIQWQAILSTTDNDVTPVIQSVTIWYY